MVVTRVLPTGRHTSWAKPRRKRTLNRRPKLCAGLWRRSAIAHHVPAPRARSRCNLLCAACGVPSASARRQHRSAVRSGQVVQDAVSPIFLQHVLCMPRRGRAAAVRLLVELSITSSMCRAEIRWLGVRSSDAPPLLGSPGRINGACATEECHWYRDHRRIIFRHRGCPDVLL